MRHNRRASAHSLASNFARNDMNDRVANTMIIAGAVLIAVGAGMVYVPAGVIVGGAMTLYGGVRLAVTA